MTVGAGSSAVLCAAEERVWKPLCSIKPGINVYSFKLGLFMQ